MVQRYRIIASMFINIYLSQGGNVLLTAFIFLFVRQTSLNNFIKITDRIIMKILPEMYLSTINLLTTANRLISKSHQLLDHEETKTENFK